MNCDPGVFSTSIAPPSTSPVDATVPRLRIAASWIGSFPLLSARSLRSSPWLHVGGGLGRKLTALTRQLEHDLPTVPVSVPSLDRPQTSSDVEQDLTAQSVERLERMLGESEAEWPRAQPFLDTSPLTHEVDEQASNVGRGERYG